MDKGEGKGVRYIYTSPKPTNTIIPMWARKSKVEGGRVGSRSLQMFKKRKIEVIYSILEKLLYLSIYIL